MCSVRALDRPKASHSPAPSSNGRPGRKTHRGTAVPIISTTVPATARGAAIRPSPIRGQGSTRV